MMRLWVLAAILASACNAPVDTTTRHRLQGGNFTLQYTPSTGALEVNRINGASILENAFAEVAVRLPDNNWATVYRTNDEGFDRSVTVSSGDNELGFYRRLVIELTGHDESPDLTWTLSAYAPYFTAELEAHNHTAGDIILDRLVPAKVDVKRDGALRLGAHPSTHRILEAGSAMAFDFFVDIVPGDTPQSVDAAVLGEYTGEQKGHSVSNANHAIKDLVTGRAFVAGALDFDHATPFANVSFDPVESDDAFTLWSIEFPYLPNGKPLPVGGNFAAGPVLVLPWDPDPHAALELYAWAVAQHNDIVLWPERGPDNRVPTGWNSWTGSGGSGGYGTGIDEALMLDNMRAMAREFLDFGGEWFQLDDGYEYYYGDWDWRPDRFPGGSAWFAEQIENEGMIPGVWIAPYGVDSASQTFAEHVDDGWFAPRDPILGGDMPVPDLTHPEVLAWLEDRFRKIRADGYRWLKTDFAYRALGALEFHDPTVTREEAYRRGLTAIQRGLDAGALETGGTPGDVFWVSVAMAPVHIGFIDSLRPNLDTMPAWEHDDSSAARKLSQGFKPTVRTIARRFYQQNRVFIFNHDMLFFRSHPNPEIPPVTRDEARCLLTAMALSGSVAKLGERIVEMEPAWIEDYRRALPVYGHAARPIDLFEREYPEIWHLPIDPEDGLNTRGRGPEYDVIALFHWGENFDLTENPYTIMADAPRTISVDLDSLGLDGTYVAREMWSGAVQDNISGVLTRSVSPHSTEVWALRPRLDRPQYIGGNRHILQGAVEMRDITWDGTSLTVTYDAAPGSALVPTTHVLAFWIPDGFTLLDIDAHGPTLLTRDQHDRVLTVRFQVETRRDVNIRLSF